MTLRQVVHAMGVGYHAVVPDFADVRTPEDAVDRGLGLYRLGTLATETHLRGVDREVQVAGEQTRVVYHTPCGSVSCAFSYTEEMRRAGVTISWLDEHLLKGPEDIAPLQYIFENAGVVRTYEQYREWQREVGEDGLAVAHGGGAASPMHHILHDLMEPVSFFLARRDCPHLLRSLAESMEPWFRALVTVLAESPAEVVLLGSNYDETITYPPFFEEHLLPWLREAAAQMHARGKLLLTHTDGENRGLLPLYRRAGFDIAESVCPAPMTKLTLAEAAAELPGVTIWGGIPSVALLEGSMDEADFLHLVGETVAFGSGRGHLILGIADTTPAAAAWGRITKITEAVN